MLWPQHSRWQLKALQVLLALLASLLPLVQQNLPARRKLTQKLIKTSGASLIVPCLWGKEAQDKLLGFEDSNQADIDKLDSKYEYHLIKVKLVYEKGDEDYPLDTIEMFPRVLDLKGKQIEQEVFPSIPKERMFLDYSLFPGAEHEGYIAIMVPKDGDYRVSFNLSDPVFFSTTKE